MSLQDPSIFEQLNEGDAEADARRMKAAEADVAAGRVVPNTKVVEWLKTWGTPDRKLAPFSWRK